MLSSYPSKLSSLLVAVLFCSAAVQAQDDPPVAPSWIDFEESASFGGKPILPDFSYSGYRFSEEQIPDVSGWQRFDVTNFGAVANDNLHDDVGIQAAIDAAEAHSGPAVVFFPPGRFVVSADNSVNNFIQINGSNIVLKGSGSGEGGTEIFMDKMRVRNGHFQFVFQPARRNTGNLTSIKGAVERNDFTVTVNDPSRLRVGMSITIRHQSPEFAQAHFGNLALSPRWTGLFGNGNGMNVRENHKITAINGNEVTFKNPIQTDMPELPRSFAINHLTTIKEVGVEDILFVGNWPSVGEDFVHHKNDIHDYAWNALQFRAVENAWLRNCEFKDWNQVMDIRESMAVTVENVKISGKPAHATYITRSSYGLLIKDCVDETGGNGVKPMWHGPGVGFSGVSTVYLRCKMPPNQMIDAHSGSPYVSLYDNIDGGTLLNQGGPERLYPNHGRHFVSWNHKHNNNGRTINYNFWSLSRRINTTFAEPYFIGFQPTNRTTFLGAGLNEMNGREVFPKSLFEAQLALRLPNSTSTNDRVINDLSMTVTPNPVHNELIVSSDSEAKSVEIYNISGQRMAVRAVPTFDNREFRMDMGHLPSGIYLVRMQTERGVSSRKVIKR